jgi:O-antigen ligase
MPPAAGRARGTAAGLTVAALLLALQFQMVTLTGRIVEDGAGDGGIKPYHLVVALVGFGLMLRGRVARLPTEVCVYFSVVCVTTLAAYLVLPPQRAIVNTILCVFAAIAGATLARDAGPRRVLLALRVTFVGSFAAVVAKDFLHADAFARFFLKPDGHPIIPTFCVGGANLEATWVSLGGAFFIGTPFLSLYVAASAALGTVYASRVGVITAGLVLGAEVVRRAYKPRGGGAPARRPGLRLVGGAVVLATMGALLFRLTSGDSGLAAGPAYVLERFQNVGDEPGSLGRVALWRGGLGVFARYPLGVGQGNAVPQIRHLLGADLPENNLHNVYLQQLVDAGIPGLASYLVVVAATLHRLVRSRGQDRLLIYVACYFALGTLQFSGADFLLWLVFGLQRGLDLAGATGGPATV